MKIAHIAPSFYPAFAYGGPTETVYRLCRATARAGCEVRVLTTDANGRENRLDVSTSGEIPLEQGLRVRYSHRQAGHSISGGLLRRLPALIRWADVVHLEAVYSFPILPTLALARLMGKPVVWSPRGAFARWKGVRRPGLKSAYDHLCGGVRGERLLFHFTSDPEKEASLKRFPGAEGIVIPNGVDCPEGPDPSGGSEMLRLLYLGRLDPIKGIENLLDACARLSRSFKGKWRLTIAGGGEPGYTSGLGSRIRELGLQESVRMIGRVDGKDKEIALAQADAVVVPSHLENFCIVVAEALARGIPVIASRGAPWPRLESEGCGLWVDNDPESLARAMERMSTLPRREMGRKGRAWMKAEFSWDRVGAQMIQLYQRLVGAKK